MQRHSTYLIPAVLAALLFLLVLFLLQQDERLPLYPVDADELPFFDDDLEKDSLLIALNRQINYLSKKEAGAPFELAGKRISQEQFRNSLRDFAIFLRGNPEMVAINTYLQDHFDIYQAGGRHEKARGEMLVTGYYEPLFRGSFTKDPPYLYPLYSLPPELEIVDEKGSKRVVRRLDDGSRVDFWSRGEIENEDLLAGNELIYLADPFDAYLLHVQGSGRILLPDGKICAVRFAGSNGLIYMSIGKLLVDKGIFSKKEISIPVIRSYLKAHPQRQKEILHHNPRYIFFSLGDGQGPIGSIGEVLTPGRSIAIDHGVLPGMALAWLQSKKPILNQEQEIDDWRPLTRFVLPQDAGSAIKGSGRIDLFWGRGDYAEIAAGNMQESGLLYFFIPKKEGG